MKELPQVGFSEAAQNFFRKCFQFKGRIRRSEYWWGVLTVLLASIVLSLIPIVGWIATFFLSIGGISMLFRRLHDTGRSGWWWGCQTLIGLAAGVLFLSVIDIHAYMTAAQSQDMTKMIRVLSAGMAGSTGIFALLLYLVNGHWASPSSYSLSSTASRKTTSTESRPSMSWNKPERKNDNGMT